MEEYHFFRFILKLHTRLHRNKLLLSNLQKYYFKMLLIAVGVNRAI